MKSLTGTEVLARMKAGDRPTLKGGYTNTSVFDDGAVARHNVMTRLKRIGRIEVPQGTSIHSRWSLAKEEKIARVISIEDTTHKAVHAALGIIDKSTEGTSKKGDGPCGDALAYKLHETILAALHAHFKHPDRAPAFVRAADIKVECFTRDLESADRNFKAKVAEAYADLERHEQHVAEQRTISKCSQEGG